MILCAELYLVAYRIQTEGAFDANELAWVICLIFQTVLTFFLVSLSASDVHDQVFTFFNVQFEKKFKNNLNPKFKLFNGFRNIN